jgi:surface polysaccharide O-acyltransferase-like enzyme
MPVFFMVNGYLILKRETFDFSYWKRKVLNIARVLIIWGVINSLYLLLLISRLLLGKFYGMLESQLLLVVLYHFGFC